MLDPILTGIGFGLILAVILGPVFFTLLQTALHEGFKAGVHLAFGVFLSDSFWILILYFFAAKLELLGDSAHAKHHYASYIGWIGGIVLIVFGFVTAKKEYKVKQVDDNRKTVHAKFVLKGFVLNTFNPAVPIFWLGVLSLLALQKDYTKSHELVFFGSVLATAFGCDLGKSYVAEKIKAILKPNVLHWLNRILGVILIGVGVRMIIKIL